MAQSIPGLWQKYYFQRSGRIYDIESWLDIRKSLNALEETFAVRMSAELPWSLAAWFGVILRALVFIIPLRALIFISRRFSQTWPEDMRAGWNRMSGHASSGCPSASCSISRRGRRGAPTTSSPSSARCS